ncbi:hypothetical protein HDU98_002044 [Podochytrium sp. JEL0797]|nr:hypothetical protein HDU98_002044 [Podochytrium sp. JEL0797]
MARTVNKKNVNYNKVVRDRKRAFKMSKKIDSGRSVVTTNKLIMDRNAAAPDFEFESKTVLRKAKLGKNNSIIRPTEYSNKKLKKLGHADKVERARLIAAGVLDAEMAEEGDDIMENTPRSKRRSARSAQLVLEWNAKDASASTLSLPIPCGNGTTLGKPGVMF